MLTALHECRAQLKPATGNLQFGEVWFGRDLSFTTLGVIVSSFHIGINALGYTLKNVYNHDRSTADA